MYSSKITQHRNTEKLQKLSSDVGAMQIHLQDVTEKMARMLPVIDVEYKPMITKDWRKLVQQANSRCKHPKADKLAVLPDDFDSVVARLEQENPHGLPRFKNTHDQWQVGDLESDLFYGDYKYSYIAPRLLNQALRMANIEYMVKTPTGKYRVQLKINSNTLYLGWYHNKDIAVEVYKSAKQEYLTLLADHYRDYLPNVVTDRLRSFIV